MDSGAWVAIWLFANLVAVGVYDLAAVFSGGRINTVSSWVQHWSSEYTVIPFACGLVIGHIFFGTAGRSVSAAVLPSSLRRKDGKDHVGNG